MGKSRVEKNKELYEELDSNTASHHGLDLDAFELEDLGDATNDTKTEEFNLEDIGNIEVDVADVKEVEETPIESEPVFEVKEETKEEQIVPVLTNDEYVVEQPVSYNDMLVAEEALRAKLEKQKELKDSKKGLKRSPVTDTYTAEMMQKNIKQNEGVDVRKELNIKIKKSNGGAIVALSILLVLVVAVGAALTYIILKH